MNYDWNFGRLLPYWNAFLSGTLTTLALTILVVVFGTVFGIMVGLLLRRSGMRLMLYPVIDVVRALPPLVLILFLYLSPDAANHRNERTGVLGIYHRHVAKLGSFHG